MTFVASPDGLPWPSSTNVLRLGVQREPCVGGTGGRSSLIFFCVFLVTTSKAPVTTSMALVPNSFLLLEQTDQLSSFFCILLVHKVICCQSPHNEVCEKFDGPAFARAERNC